VLHRRFQCAHHITRICIILGFSIQSVLNRLEMSLVLKFRKKLTDFESIRKKYSTILEPSANK